MNNLTSQLLHNVFKSFPKELTRSSTNTEELISLAVVSFTLVTWMFDLKVLADQKRDSSHSKEILSYEIFNHDLGKWKESRVRTESHQTFSLAFV